MSNLEGKKIAVLDIETTGFLPQGGKIIEVGIVSLDVDSGEVLPMFNSLCNEVGITDKDKTAWIFSNSDMDFDEVMAAPSLIEIQLDIEEALRSCDASTAYNKVFDFGFMRDREIKVGAEVTCPMRAATPICKLPSSRGYKWPKVEEAWKHFFPGVEYVELHRGLDDAAHEAQILHELIQLGVIEIES